MLNAKPRNSTAVIIRILVSTIILTAPGMALVGCKYRRSSERSMPWKIGGIVTISATNCNIPGRSETRKHVYARRQATMIAKPQMIANSRFQ